MTDEILKIDSQVATLSALDRVTFGCRSGALDAALRFYREQIVTCLRDERKVTWQRDYDAERLVLREFFEDSWRAPKAELSGDATAWLCGQSAFVLQVLGFLKDSSDAGLTAVKTYQSLAESPSDSTAEQRATNLIHAAFEATKLVPSLLFLGDWGQALAVAKEARNWSFSLDDECFNSDRAMIQIRPLSLAAEARCQLWAANFDEAAMLFDAAAAETNQHQQDLGNTSLAVQVAVPRIQALLMASRWGDTSLAETRLEQAIAAADELRVRYPGRPRTAMVAGWIAAREDHVDSGLIHQLEYAAAALRRSCQHPLLVQLLTVLAGLKLKVSHSDDCDSELNEAFDLATDMQAIGLQASVAAVRCQAARARGGAATEAFGIAHSAIQRGMRWFQQQLAEEI